MGWVAVHKLELSKGVGNRVVRKQGVAHNLEPSTELDVALDIHLPKRRQERILLEVRKKEQQLGTRLVAFVGSVQAILGDVPAYQKMDRRRAQQK